MNGAASPKPSVNARWPDDPPNCQCAQLATRYVCSAKTTTAATVSFRVQPRATNAPATDRSKTGDQKNSPFCVLKRTATRCGDASENPIWCVSYALTMNAPVANL